MSAEEPVSGFLELPELLETELLPIVERTPEQRGVLSPSDLARIFEELEAPGDPEAKTPRVQLPASDFEVIVPARDLVLAIHRALQIRSSFQVRAHESIVLRER